LNYDLILPVMKTRLSHTFPSLPWRAGLPTMVLLFFLNIAEPAENSEDSAWWHPYIDEFLYIPFKEDIGVWGPADMVGGPKGKHGDIYSQRMVAGKVLWATPFMVDAGIGLPDIESCSDWLKIGALVRSATAFYGLEIIQGATKWVEVGSRSIDHIPFSVKIESASNFQEIIIPGIPAGKSVRDLAQLTMGIPIPRRCITLLSGDGKNYDRFIVHQPYCWWDETMYAAGIAWIEDATP